MRSRILGPVVATVMVAATGFLVAPAAGSAAPVAAAAACSTASGVSVVVDFKELGGGVTAGCDGDAGGPASQNFADAGYQLSYSQAPGMNGFVCKVQGKPADGDCAQTDSFWSLWWSDGKSGRWVFSSRGVSSLTVPAGGYVAFAWHQGGGDAQPPAAVPAAHQEPQPSEEPQQGDQGGDGSDGNLGSGGGRGDGSDGDGGSDGDAPEADDPSSTTDATPSDRRTDAKRDRVAGGKNARGRDRAKGDDEAGATPTDPDSSGLPEVGDIVDGPPPEATADDEGSSLPTWIAIALAALVLGAAAAVPLIRRRTG